MEYFVISISYHADLSSRHRMMTIWTQRLRCCHGDPGRHQRQDLRIFEQKSNHNYENTSLKSHACVRGTLRLFHILSFNIHGSEKRAHVFGREKKMKNFFLLFCFAETEKSTSHFPSSSSFLVIPESTARRQSGFHVYKASASQIGYLLFFLALMMAFTLLPLHLKVASSP